MEVGNLAYIELMSVLFPSPVSPTTISVNSKPLFTDFLYTWWHQIWLILVSNVTALGGYWWHQIWLTLIWVETGLEGCWLLQSPNVSHHVSLIYITQPRFNHHDLAQSRTRMRLLPDWASLRIPHNHPIAVEVFSQVGPETKRKLHAGMISIVGDVPYLRLRWNVPWFGGELWFLYSVSPNPVARAAVLSRAQLGQSVLKSVILKLNINDKNSMEEVTLKYLHISGSRGRRLRGCCWGLASIYWLRVGMWGLQYKIVVKSIIYWLGGGPFQN